MKTEEYSPARLFSAVVNDIYNTDKKTRIKFVCPRCKIVTHEAIVFAAMQKSFKEFKVTQKITYDDGLVELRCRHI